MIERFRRTQCARVNVCALLLSLLATLLAGTAHAQCNITSVTSISPLTHSAGTFTPPTTPTSTSLSLTITFIATSGATGNQNCRGRLTFQRATLPPVMTSGGGATMQYTIRSTATGGNTLLITGGTPANTQRVTFNVTGPARNTSASRTVTVTVFPLLQPTAPFFAGSYSDTALNLQIFNDPTGPPINLVTSQPYTMTGTVTTSCTITSPVNTSQVIAVSSLGQTTGMATASPSFTVACTNISDVTLTSQNGAVTLGGVAEGALPALADFRNKIEYSASIDGGAGVVTLNTASTSVVTGVFRTVTTSVTPSVTITPEASTTPLVAGSYSDVLTVSVIPR